MGLNSEMPGLDWLWSLKPWGGVGDFGLEDLKKVASCFNNPQDSFSSIHVAGTNGKGSVCAFLSAIASEDGRSVGVMTSPHLIRVNERIVVDGSPISDEELDRLASSILQVCKESGYNLSFFECITLAGFLYFREKRVDLAVIEVGLGGRLDATNIMNSPLASVIVSIGLDHLHVLGGDESSIAREKAGIAKLGVPLFLGERVNCVSDIATGVISKHANDVGAPVIQLGVGSHVDFGGEQSGGGAKLVLSHCSIRLAPRLLGRHQVYNSALAALVAEYCGFSLKSIESGIEKAYWPARMECFEFKDRRIFIDCAHNEPGFQTVADFIRGEGIKEVVAVLGFLKTKQWQKMINIIDDLVAEAIVLRPESEQAEEVEAIAKVLSGAGVLTQIHDGSYAELIDQLLSDRYKNRTMFCMGSIYLVSHIRDALRKALP